MGHVWNHRLKQAQAQVSARLSRLAAFCANAQIVITVKLRVHKVLSNEEALSQACPAIPEDSVCVQTKVPA